MSKLILARPRGTPPRGCQNGSVTEDSSQRWLPPVATPPPAPTPSPVPEQRPPWEEERRGILRRIGSAIVAGLVVLAKFGKAALLLLPKLKILTTSGSMLVSVLAYSLIWGWQFALGFVVLLFI